MITHVAIKDENGKVHSLPKPNRHHHIFIYNKNNGIDNKPLRLGTQGFLKDGEDFLDRTESYKHAIECNQVFLSHDPSNNSLNLKSDSRVKELFSEDLW